MNNKAILFLVEDKHQFKFFSRFKNVVVNNNLIPIYLMLNYSMHLDAEKKKYNSIYIGTQCGFDCQLQSKNKAKNNNKEISHTYISLFKVINEIEKRYEVERIFLWNGATNCGQICQSLLKGRIVFFELANIPGKTFCDSKGVNRLASFYKDISIIDSLPLDIQKYNIWLEKYLKIKFSDYVIPQARKNKEKWSEKIHNIILDYYGIFFKGGCNENQYSLVRRTFLFLKKLVTNKETIKKEAFDSYNYVDNDYVFYPMQCVNDTQLIYNSHVNNLEAIQIAYNYSQLNQLDLVIKLHPVEAKEKNIKQLRNYLHKKNITAYIVNANTMELLNNAKHVYTINSTVGLEAMILNKPLTILGYSLYDNFDDMRLKKYITEYLIDSDPYDVVEFNDEQFYKIINQ